LDYQQSGKKGRLIMTRRQLVGKLRPLMAGVVLALPVLFLFARVGLVLR
jgi:hypothetical protein